MRSTRMEMERLMWSSLLDLLKKWVRQRAKKLKKLIKYLQSKISKRRIYCQQLKKAKKSMLKNKLR